MNFKTLFSSSKQALISHKSRSLLTILGIVIGIASIIVIMATTTSATQLILGEVQGMGSKTFELIPGKKPKGPSDFAQLFTESIKDRELNAVLNKRNVPYLDKVSPNILVTGSLNYEGNISNPSVFGSSTFMAEILDIEPVVGRMFDDSDIKARAKVIVIGSEVAEDLFEGDSVLGKKIRIKGVNFRVIGLLPPKGRVAFANIDKLALMPYTTAKDYVQKQSHYNSILGQSTKEEYLERTVEDIKLTLREIYDITDEADDNFHIQTQQDLVERVSTITNILSSLLIAVAAISLIVGGIGIMNVMLVSVTERTKEIGIRKSVGATNRDIRNQFLVEAVMLTFAGGFLGVVLGAGISKVVSIVLSKSLEVNWAYVVPLDAIFIAVGASSFVGVLFGLYPAISASKKNPINTLRYE